MSEAVKFVPVNYVSKSPNLMRARPLGEPGSGRFIMPMSRTVFASVDKKSLSKKRIDALKKKGLEVDVEKEGSYGLGFVIPPEADFSLLKENCEAMAMAAFGKKVGIKMPWSNADEKHEPEALGVVSLEGFKKFSANSYVGPITVKDQANKLVPNDQIPSLLYNGSFILPEVKLATFDNESQGLKLYLQGVQIVRNDPIRAPKIAGGAMGGEDFDVITDDDDAAMDEAFA